MSWPAFDPRSTSGTNTQPPPMWTTTDGASGRGVTQRAVEVPLPADNSKTQPLPIITLSSKVPTQQKSIPQPAGCSRLVDEGPRCLSLPVSRIQEQHQQQLQQQQRQKQTELPYTNCSSSCDNLSLFIASDVREGMGRLSKASSDNPVYSSGSPPIPPRDYIPRAHSRPILETQKSKPEIHPIVQDGQKCSNTHYWLLPDKQKTSSSLDAVDKVADDEQHYINVPNNGVCARKFGLSKFYANLRKPAGKENARSHHVSDSAAESSHRSVFYSDMVPLLSDVSSLDSMSVNLPIDDLEPEVVVLPSSEERTTSMGEANEMIEKVRSKIGGVSVDESITALSTHHWNVDKAVEYLKVENLFRLGLAPRERCRQMLEANGWDLDRAASRLVDMVTSNSSKNK